MSSAPSMRAFVRAYKVYYAGKTSLVPSLSNPQIFYRLQYEISLGVGKAGYEAK